MTADRNDGERPTGGAGAEPACSSGREATHGTHFKNGFRYRVGCALLPKKVARYLTPTMRRVAEKAGLELVEVDHRVPLLEQDGGTMFDAIMHKLRPNADWERNLQEYIKAHPDVKVIDSLSGIRIVHNRATMLLPLRELPEGIKLQSPHGANGTGISVARIQSPTQVEIVEGTSLAEAEAALRRAGLVPPLLVKPLWTDGREGSHGLAVLHDLAALGQVLRGGVVSELKPPLVVQQFVEHGGVLFKVYVLGLRTVVCRRPSLGDSYLGNEARRAGVLSLPRISCKANYAPAEHRRQSSSGGGAGSSGPSSFRGSEPPASSPAAASACAADAPGPTPSGGGPPRAHAAPGDAAAAAAATPPPPPAPAAPGSAPPQAQAQPAPQPEQPQPEQPQPQPQPPLGRSSVCGADGRSADGSGGGGGWSSPAMPPDWVTNALAGTLRDKLGLQLFNFDMICPEDQAAPGECLYYVVDINYFPGVDKIPNFERIFVDFLAATCGAGGGAANGAAANGAAANGRGGSEKGEAGHGPAA